MVSIHDDGNFATFVVCAAALCLVLAVAHSRPGDDEGLRAAGASGLVDARVIDSGWLTLRCSRDDLWWWRMRATNQARQAVTVTVCCGIFKDCTVRY